MSSSMKTVGSILKEAREKKGLTLTDIHKFIKIHPKYLQALEDNDYQIFSSTVHIKGFLKVYASLLELNVDDILAFFRREFDEKSLAKARIIKPIENPKFLITPTSVVVTVTLLLVLGFFSYLFYQYRSYTGAPSLVIENPNSDMTSSNESVEVVGRTDRDSAIFLNGQKLNINPDGTFVMRVNLSEGLNALNFLAVNKLGKETKITRNIVLKKEEPTVAGTKVTKMVLEVSTAKKSSTIVVFTDGTKSFDGTMLPDTSRAFEASESIKFKARDAGAVSLKFNGKDLGVFGKSGEVKEEEFK